jgi:hypothetical protein
MSFSLLPLPHIGLADGSDATELALNLTVYVMTLGLVGSLVWLCALAWRDRAE